MRTKKALVKMGLADCAVSLSRMTSVAACGVPAFAPCTLTRRSSTFSDPSTCASLMSGTWTVFGCASPAAHETVSMVVA
jgi:hypothetical protein